VAVPLLTALALIFVIEGALYALFPAAMKRVLAHAQEMPDGAMRAAGLLAAAFGVVMVWLIRG